MISLEKNFISAVKLYESQMGFKMIKLPQMRLTALYSYFV